MSSEDRESAGDSDEDSNGSSTGTAIHIEDNPIELPEDEADVENSLEEENERTNSPFEEGQREENMAEQERTVPEPNDRARSNAEQAQRDAHSATRMQGEEYAAAEMERAAKALKSIRNQARVDALSRLERARIAAEEESDEHHKKKKDVEEALEEAQENYRKTRPKNSRHYSSDTPVIQYESSDVVGFDNRQSHSHTTSRRNRRQTYQAKNDPTIPRTPMGLLIGPSNGLLSTHGLTGGPYGDRRDTRQVVNEHQRKVAEWYESRHNMLESDTATNYGVPPYDYHSLTNRHPFYQPRIPRQAHMYGPYQSQNELNWWECEPGHHIDGRNPLPPGIRRLLGADPNTWSRRNSRW
jgi:hypothetical protein